MINPEYSISKPPVFESKKPLLRRGIVFAAEPTNGRVTEQVSDNPMREIGQLVKEYRKVLRESRTTFGARFDARDRTLGMWESRGPSRMMFVPLAQLAEDQQADQRVADTMRESMIDILSDSDPNELALREDLVALRERSEERKWMRTIHNTSLDKAVRYIRFAEGLKTSQLEKESEVSRYTFLRNHKRMQPNILRLLIDASVLDTDGKPAQLLHLKNQQKEPLSLDALQTSTTGQILQYLRIIMGHSQNTLAEATGKAQSVIAYVEAKERPPTYLHTLLELLQLDPTDPLAEIIQKKANKEKIIIDEDKKTRLLKGNILFTEHLNNIGPYPLSQKDRVFLEETAESSVGTIMSRLRTEKGLSQLSMANLIEAGQDQISRIENNRKMPEHGFILRLMKYFDYDIHHPLTQRLLALSEEKVRAEKSHSKSADNN